MSLLLLEVAAKLLVSLDLKNTGFLMHGQSGVDGNIPELDRSALPVRLFMDFTSRVAREIFQNLLYKYIGL